MVTEHNPYAPPAAAMSEASAVSQEIEEEPASRGRRFANLLIDTVCYYALAVVVGIVIALVDPSFFDHMSAAGNYLFGAGVIVIYYVPSEALFGRTMGKLVTRTRVVSQSGGPPDFLQALRRTLIRFVPFEAFTFLSEKSVGLHDRWSETRVVLTRSEYRR
jgi:uncharacterized RDD family membrane protein YckC